MSNYFDALFFYGMPIAGDPGWELVEIFEDNKYLEIWNLSPMTDSGYMLFARESYHSGNERRDEKLVRFSARFAGKENEWRQLIRNACDRHQLEYVEPEWYFATKFS